MPLALRRRDLLRLAGAALLAPSAGTAQAAATAIDLARWRTVRIGAGGFITGIDIAPDGTTVARTDTYGAWIWEPETTAWRQLVTVETMPPDDRHEDSAASSWPLDVVLAPSEPMRIYLAIGGWIYRSDDRGWSFRRTAASAMAGMGEPADDAKVNGRKLAVDPRDADVLFVGAPRGPMRRTTDGGETWSDVAGLPAAHSKGQQAMGYLVLFDPFSAEAGGRTATLYASAWGCGVFRSEDCGVTWQPLPGAPRCLRHAAIARGGTLFAVGEEPATGLTRVFRFADSWADITPQGGRPLRWHSVSACPHRAGRIVVGREDGALCESLNGGTSWGAVIEGEHVRREARDIPWLSWTDETWMSNGDIRFDPSAADRLLFAQGIGVWAAAFPPGSTAVAWTSQSMNIEQLVANQCVHAPAPDAVPLFACWDRAIWRLADPDAYPERHLPGPQFSHCWGMDYAGSDPQFLAAAVSSQQATDAERSCFSWDGGASWQPFAAYPRWRDGKAGKGFIAVSTPLNMVWVPVEGRGMPHFTLDGGSSWRPCVLPGLRPEDAPGFGSADYLRRYILCADRVEPHRFYLLHYPKGLFASTDGGATWLLVHGFGSWNERFHSKLRAAPDRASHLFHTAGHSNANRQGGFIRSRDGGRSWTVVPHLREVADFAFGNAAPGAPHPTIFVAGYHRDEWGIYRSIDDGTQWTRIGDGFPTGSLDRIVALEGDKHEFGKVYVGFRGSGWAYGVV